MGGGYKDTEDIRLASLGPDHRDLQAVLSMLYFTQGADGTSPEFSREEAIPTF